MSEDKIAFPPSKKRLLPSQVHSEGGKKNEEEDIPPILFVDKPHFLSEESEPENSSHYNQTSQQRHKLQKHDKLKRPERKNKSNSGLNETNRYIFSFKCFFLILFSSFNVPVFVISLSSFGSLKTSSPYIPTQTSRD